MKSLSILSLVVLAACGSKPPSDEAVDSGTTETGTTETGTTETGTTETGTTETGDTEVEINPKDGNYMGRVSGVNTNECDIDADEILQDFKQNVELWFIRNGTDVLLVPVVNGSPEERLTCTATSSDPDGGTPSLLCLIESSKDQIHPDLDAMLVSSFSLSGTWQSDAMIAGDLNYDFTCEGSDCAKAIEVLKSEGAPFIPPCTTSFGFEADWTEEEVPEETKVTPRDGDYIAILESFEKDECDVKETDLRGYTNGKNGFQMTLSNTNLKSTPFLSNSSATDASMCQMNGTTYSCEVDTQKVVMKQYDATFVYITDHVGGWDTDTEISGTMRYQVSCTGKDCATANKVEGFVSTLPCTTHVAYSGTRE